MYTYCPGCAAIFRITAETVSAAGGRVRCGQCDRVFNAVDRLYDDAVSARHAALLHTGQGLPDTGVTQPQPRPQQQPPAAFETVHDDVAEAGRIHRPLPATGWTGRSFTSKDLLSGLATGLLVLLLGMQWVYFNRGTLAADAGMRPALERFCSVLHCNLPLRTDLAKLEIIDRDVRKHPQEEAALLINASIANRADFTQPYPVFEISFSDTTGKSVAMRRFLPAEYLHPGSNTTAGMAPNVPVQIVLEIQDPGDQAVSFQFGFL
jgi:predicted Zn finger-like uncharacterized protein